MRRLTLPVRVFISSIVVMSVLFLGALLTIGLLARQSVIAQATQDVEILAEVIKQVLNRESAIPVALELTVSDDMVTTARLVARWAASLEGLPDGQATLNGGLADVVQRTNIQRAVVTDSEGAVQIDVKNAEQSESSPHQGLQPEMPGFSQLLAGNESVVIQTSERSEAGHWFKTVGIRSVDVPRIVYLERDASDLKRIKDAIGVSDLIQLLLAQSSIQSLILTDSNLQPLSADDRAVEFAEEQRGLVRQMFSLGMTVTEITESTINVASPIASPDGIFQGAVYVSLSAKPIDELLKRIVRVSLLIFFIGVSVSGALAFLVSTRIAAPISRLNRAARAIKRGNYEFASNLKTEGTQSFGLRQLIAVFRDMASRVKLREEELDVLVQARNKELQEKNKLLLETQSLMNEQLNLARQLQHASLPAVFPAYCEGLGGAAKMLPALQVGGDFYDSFALSTNRVAVVIADVSGKGVAAAFFASVAKNLLREIASHNQSPAICLSRLNEALIEQNPISLFITLSFAIFDIESRTMTFASAGHPLPIIFDDYGVDHLAGHDAGPALGIIDKAVFQDTAVVLKRGDSVVFYTDGVTEAVNEREQELSAEKFEDFLSTLGSSHPKITLDKLLDLIARHAGDAPQSDDITLAIVSYE
jgi:sigma-B regulation protein RsbU (phosphoserine phosphatase)